MMKKIDVVASLVFALAASVTADAAIINVVSVNQDLSADADMNAPSFDQVSDTTLPPVSLSVSSSEGGNNASASQTINAYSLSSSTLVFDIVAVSDLSVVGSVGNVGPNSFTFQFELTAPLAYTYSAIMSATSSFSGGIELMGPTTIDSILHTGAVSSSGILDAGMYYLIADSDLVLGGVGEFSSSYSVSLILGPTSVPEPSSFFALGAGAFALTFNRRRKPESWS